jgi:hypothetical protein
MNNRNNIFLFLLLQMITVYNATMLGWNVKKIGINTYEISIKKSACDTWKINDLNKIIDDIVSYKIIS